MIIDVNTFLGHYPFRQLRFTTGEGLLRHLDDNGLEAAVVSPVHAVFYRDGQRGNEELFEEIARAPKRLFPVASINPRYAGWQRDLRWCVEQGRAVAVAVWPEHHGYKLTDAMGDAVLKAIVELDRPVVLTQRIEDRRQRHHWDVAEDLPAALPIELAKSHPKLRMFLCNWLGLDGEKLQSAGLKERVLLDFARMHVVMNKDVPKLFRTLGSQAVAFGSHMPFDYVAPSLVKLANIEELFPETLEAVSWKNAATFFRLPVGK